MPRKANFLNVKNHLKVSAEIIQIILDNDGKYPGGTQLAPIDRQALNEMRFISEVILRKHAKRNTRKDIYIEARVS